MEPNPFTAVDRTLLKRCLHKEPGSWNDFVDRFLSLIYHVIGYTAHLRSVRLNPEDVEDIAAEVLLKIVAGDFRVLREFRGHASLATYLTVIARRICVHELARKQQVKEKTRLTAATVTEGEPDDAPAAQKGLERLDEVDRLLKRLGGREREIVRLYYLEGRTYEEISTETDVPVNTIGAVLSRARKKLRELVKRSAEIPVVKTRRRPRKAEAPTGPKAEAPAARKAEAPATPAPAPSPPPPPPKDAAKPE